MTTSMSAQRLGIDDFFGFKLRMRKFNLYLYIEEKLPSKTKYKEIQNNVSVYDVTLDGLSFNTAVFSFHKDKLFKAVFTNDFEKEKDALAFFMSLLMGVRETNTELLLRTGNTVTWKMPADKSIRLKLEPKEQYYSVELTYMTYELY